MNDELRLDSDEHVDFMSYILDLYKKYWTDVVCFIGDNISVNKCISTIIKVPLIGCAIHRFNLVVQNFLSTEELLLTKINVLMVKLRNLLFSACLNRLTSLRP